MNSDMTLLALLCGAVVVNVLGIMAIKRIDKWLNEHAKRKVAQ